MAARDLLVKIADETQFFFRNIIIQVVRRSRPAVWPLLRYRQPPPHRAKRAVLTRYGLHAQTWVETGTYFGHTTRWLATVAQKVVTIEPEGRLASRASRQMSHLKNVTVVRGFSESVLPQIMSSLSGSVSFWLDGHFSEGVTARGESVTPIVTELAQIEQHLFRLGAVTVFVDDFRLFESRKTDKFSYPERTLLVNWASKNQLSWTVEHDIFVASTLQLELIA